MTNRVKRLLKENILEKGAYVQSRSLPGREEGGRSKVLELQL